MVAPGLHLAHKPVGITSFDVVRAHAPASGRWRLCHGGTLDPFADGLLLLLAGPATHLFERIHALPKSYEAEVRWGVETDNGDPTGVSVATGDASGLSPPALQAALEPFVGWLDQVPPSTSAKKVGGEPAYRRVHRGEEVVLPPSRVYLHHAEWLSHDLPRSSRLRLVARGGYYVRALARDLGQSLGCRAHLGALRRTAIGPFEDPGPGREASHAGLAAVPWMPYRRVTPDERRALKARKTLAVGTIEPAAWRVPEGFPEPEAPIAAVSAEGAVFALLRHEGPALVSTQWLSPGF